MEKQSKILEIANNLADRVEGNRYPYSYLEWIVDNCGWQYEASKSELMEACFAAINILRSKNVENAKRAPLTTLSKGQRALMRKQAKELAAMAERFLKNPVEVTRDPIKSDEDGSAYIQIAVKSGRNLCTSLFLYPNFEELSKWAGLDEINRIAYAHKVFWRFKTMDEHIADDLETIKAKLESFL